VGFVCGGQEGAYASTTMSENNDKKTERPATAKAAKDDFGVIYLVVQTGITSEQAMSLMDQFGLDFDILRERPAS
jgi:hypothetical protein